MVRILIIGLSDGSVTPFDNTYLVEYDPTREGIAPDGSIMLAHIVTTSNIAEAKVFPSTLEALECWRTAYGFREDGLPNRPLTAFTITFA